MRIYYILFRINKQPYIAYVEEILQKNSKKKK